MARGRRYTMCSWIGITGLANLRIDRWKSSKELRGWIKRKEKAPGWRSVRLGDRAILFEQGGGTAFAQVVLGRELLSITVSSPGATSKALSLAEEALPLLR